jgi:hypothetical protein
MDIQAFTKIIKLENMNGPHSDIYETSLSWPAEAEICQR